MIKELTENPEKKFRLVAGIHVVSVNPETGEVVWDDNVPLTLCTATLRDRWEEVKEPVDFIEAVKSGKRIKTEHCDTYKDLDDILLILARLEKNKRETILNRKWYIEDYEV